MEDSKNIPHAFLWRRLHSLMGLWLVIFIVQHLITNSQAALFIGNDGAGFVHAVNAIHDLPYLPLIEIFILGTPLLVHVIWGIKYINSAKYNSSKGDGSTPYIPSARNTAYTWQRVTAWILTLLVVAHVIQMRFIEYPSSAQVDTETYYFYPVSLDAGLYTVAARLGVTLYDRAEIEEKTKKWQKEKEDLSFSPFALPFFPSSQTFNEKTQRQLVIVQKHQQEENFLKAVHKWPLRKGHVLTVSPNFGTAELLMLRETFKSPLMLVLYTLLVLTACFHAFNGLWTFFIKWGVTLSQRSQRFLLIFSQLLMCFIALLGLAAVWGTYWINLKY